MRNLKILTGASSVVATALILTACNGSEAKDGERPGTPGAEAVRSVNVEVITVAAQPFTEVLRITATARASRDVVVSAEESGRISSIVVEKGARVQTGQPLLRIDDALLRTQVQQAQAVADLAQETYTRRKRLWEEDKVGSEIAYLQARYEAAQAAANLANLRERIARTIVRAPISGTLEDRRVEVGTSVAPGTPLLRIVDIGRIKVVGGVPERFAQHLSVGREVEITFGALSADVRGKVSFVGSTVDVSSRTFPIEVEVPNPAARIKPEMAADIRLPLNRVNDALVVPQQALVRAEGGFLAYVVIQRDGRLVAEQRTVTVGAISGNDVVVLSGIEAGEQLIVVGQQKVADGDVVVIISQREGERL